MTRPGFTELRRRTVAKSLLWRMLGIVWTWVGAYFIILLVPPTRKSAAVIATLIVIYHHSTRMVMYYFYERVWSGVSWGKHDPRDGSCEPMPLKAKIIWVTVSLIALGVILFMLCYAGPLIKKQTAEKSNACGRPDVSGPLR